MTCTALLSGALWVAFHLFYSWTFGFPTFLGACERIRTSGLPLLSTDRMCFDSFWDSFRLNLSWTTFTQAAGVTLAGVFLAATGRRWTAFLPALACLLVDGSRFSAATGTAPLVTRQGLGTWALAAALLCAPVLVAVLLRQEPVPERLRARWWVWLAATFILGVATLAGWWMFNQDKVPMLQGLWGWVVSLGLVSGMVVFAGILGTDRRFWPWSLVPVAILLSAGPSWFFSMPIESALRPRPLFAFGIAIPLFFLGLLWSGLRLLVRRMDGQANAREAGPVAPRGKRVVVALNVIAAVLLVASLVAFRNDPFKVLIAQPLPTYLGERNEANDVAARMNLADGLAAMQKYRDAHGSFRGFGAAEGSALAPEIPWQDHPPTRDDHSGLRGVIPMPHRDVARLATVSASGAAWCVQERDARITFGRSEPDRGLRGPDLVASAVDHCGDMPSTDPMLAAQPPRDCGAEHGYLICRMAQVLVHSILARSEVPAAYRSSFWDGWTADVPVGWHIDAEGSAVTPAVRIWSGRGGSLLSLTVTDLGEARIDRSPGVVRLPLPSDAAVGVDSTYSVRGEVAGEAYRFTVRIGRRVDPAQRELLAPLISSLMRHGQVVAGLGASYVSPPRD